MEYVFEGWIFATQQIALSSDSFIVLVFNCEIEKKMDLNLWFKWNFPGVETQTFLIGARARSYLKAGLKFKL